MLGTGEPSGDAMTPDQINHFWLSEVGPEGWYRSDRNLDDQIRDRFQAVWEQAGDLAPLWSVTPEGALAALVLTDQFPRNMFRDDARAFSTDALARQIADQAIAAGFDHQTPMPQRQFFYMPFEHSEDIRDQNRAVALFQDNMPGQTLRHAILHRDTIAHFGRFPWRNKALGRESTASEQRLLDAGGYGALMTGKLRLADL